MIHPLPAPRGGWNAGPCAGMRRERPSPSQGGGAVSGGGADPVEPATEHTKPAGQGASARDLGTKEPRPNGTAGARPGCGVDSVMCQARAPEMPALPHSRGGQRGSCVVLRTRIALCSILTPEKALTLIMASRISAEMPPLSTVKQFFGRTRLVLADQAAAQAPYLSEGLISAQRIRDVRLSLSQ
ncbi:hypothetical protein NDU88_008527 [Pleurodeles waltl]|uniref:Uncharacterized protein n=1 Tax=Pleurodeles waltl TaxID=8319 RepID=A0AAV7PPQ8_PLEWA|nr:hypothetical protein NDU88_008527 [Pleurodeles waltl]